MTRVHLSPANDMLPQILQWWTALLLVLFTGFAAFSAEQQPPGTVPADTLRAGEQMYRDGLLPSGIPMKALVKGDIPVSGAFFSCVSCHLRSGLGWVEGQVKTPAVNGEALFHELYSNPFPTAEAKQKVSRYIQPKFLRPAYTEESLMKALRQGIDPAGRTLSPVMPRYSLEDGDMAVLIAYLRTLSSHLSPGATETTLQFATVVSDGVSPEDRAAMVTPLQNYFSAHDSQADNTQSRSRYLGGFKEHDLAYRHLRLSVWELKGGHETWRQQLEEYNRRAPVFALVGGLVSGGWEPVHRFCEDHHIPCLFPITDFPVISNSDWYTLYLSKGFAQEGESTARYLHAQGGGDDNAQVVQLIRDSDEGRALAGGFSRVWTELGHAPPRDIILRAGKTPTREVLGDMPSSLLVWDDMEAIPLLEELAVAGDRPSMVFVSASYLGDQFTSLPEEVRDFTYIAYPFRLPADEVRYDGVAAPFLGLRNRGSREPVITKKTYLIIKILVQTVMHMNRNFYRDYFFDVIDMLPDQIYPLYERLSFGPRQRYASKGCYIVQLGKGRNAGLIKRNEWVSY